MSATDFPFLYGITDSRLMPDSALLEKSEAALSAGLKILQYRDKSNKQQKRLREALALKKLCNKYAAVFIVNDDINLALASEADGVHLGLQDTSIAIARSLLGEQTIIGSTCHDKIELAQNAINHGTSYLAFGRFYSSQTKADAKPAPLSVLSTAKTAFQLPIVAIGGIDTINATEVWRAGADCLAVCHALFKGQPDKNFETFEYRYREQL